MDDARLYERVDTSSPHNPPRARRANYLYLSDCRCHTVYIVCGLDTYFFTPFLRFVVCYYERAIAIFYSH